MALSRRDRAPAQGGPAGHWLTLQALVLEMDEN